MFSCVPVNFLAGSTRFWNACDFIFELLYPLPGLSQPLACYMDTTHLNLDFRQCRSYLVQFAFRLRASIVKNFHTLLFQFISFLNELFALVLGFNMLHLQMKTLIFHRFTLRLQTLEQVLHTHARAPQELTGALSDTLVESQAIGNCQRITSSW